LAGELHLYTLGVKTLQIKKDFVFLDLLLDTPVEEHFKFHRFF
jgi:hypothetical protein